MVVKKRKKKPLGWQGQIFLVTIALCAVLFSPTTILLVMGMMPTLIAIYSDTTKERMRGVTVGAMNMAGCTPFLIQLWTTSHTLDYALGILTDPWVWIIMYACAAVGYCLEWLIVGGVAVFETEQANLRIRNIEKSQEETTQRWGPEVTGKVPLDENGFALKNAPPPA